MLRRNFRRFALAVLAVLLVSVAAAASDPCVSGLTLGQKPGPYSAIVAVGADRGQAHCFICETGEHPAVIVFARQLDEPLAKLAAGLDNALKANQKAELRAWVTFLHEDQAGFDPQVVEWARKHAIRSVPLAVFEDEDGPPTYKLNRNAEVTILLFNKHKVLRNFAFRKDEWSEEQIGPILKAIPALVSTEQK